VGTRKINRYYNEDQPPTKEIEMNNLLVFLIAVPAFCLGLALISTRATRFYENKFETLAHRNHFFESDNEELRVKYEVLREAASLVIHSEDPATGWQLYQEHMKFVKLVNP